MQGHRCRKLDCAASGTKQDEFVELSPLPGNAAVCEAVLRSYREYIRLDKTLVKADS